MNIKSSFVSAERLRFRKFSMPKVDVELASPTGTTPSPQTPITEETESIHPLLQKIKDEPWFPRSTPPTLPAVIGTFMAILDNVSNEVHSEICNYIVELNE